MTSIHVESPGMFSTVQDLGRSGFGPLGVSASGAADTVSLRLGNRLVGNIAGAAALEMTLVGGIFIFPEGAAFALTGADFGATLDGVSFGLSESVKAQPGQTLRLGATRNGARCYLCVAGGIVVESFLGSSSTHVLSGLGGFGGRPLRKGDVLCIGASTDPFLKRTIAQSAREHLTGRKALRVTIGPQSDWFDDSSKHSFYSGAYLVTEDANRMGLRLQGPAISSSRTGQMMTEGVALGAIQVPESGQPIILFVEQQTTGGYPKIANVISADMHSVGQLRPRDEVRFERVSFDHAHALLLALEHFLNAEEVIEESP